MRRSASFCVAAVLFSLGHSAAQSQPSRSIAAQLGLIITDDVGYGDIGSYAHLQ
jgi:hypothetical protein